MRDAFRRAALIFATAAALLGSAPLAAREPLGVFAGWGAYRDPQGPRCYAIAVPVADRAARQFRPFAAVGTWPRRDVRGQIYLRLSRALRPNGVVSLSVGQQRFQLQGSGPDAWATDWRIDAAIVAAMRSARSMTVRATDTGGRRFSQTYLLAGAASAMDAATLACARRG